MPLPTNSSLCVVLNYTLAKPLCQPSLLYVVIFLDDLNAVRNIQNYINRIAVMS